MKFFHSFLFLLLVLSISGQTLTGSQLLDKAIAYHDPERRWPSFNDALQITMSTPNKPDRISNITINLPEEIFKINSQRKDILISQTITKDFCQYLLNGSSEISKEDKEKHKLNCDRTKLWRNYYTYLYGLPMKLKDPGTIIDPLTTRQEFKGKEYLVLKATYDSEVGKDTWYFYFDPETYAMEVYQFFKVEANNDGEYILLTGEETIGGIKMPKSRAWYYNKDDGYLGTDVLSAKGK